jgi:hypothetical protein
MGGNIGRESFRLTEDARSFASFLPAVLPSISVQVVQRPTQTYSHNGEFRGQ